MKEDILIKHLIKSGIPKDAVRDILDVAELRNIKTGKKILSIGEKSNSIFLLIKGGVIIRYNNPHNNELRTTDFHLQNYFPLFGDIESYLLKTASSSQIQSISNSYILEISRLNWDSILENSPTSKEYFINEVFRMLILENGDKKALISFSAEEMYQYLEENKPEVIKKVPSKYIAEFMGISRGYLSRIKKSMLI